MGNAFIVKRGGGGSSYNVAVKYPAGMTCTCGSKTAPDTSGYAIFPVSGAGQYTVTVTYGVNTWTKTATVTNVLKNVVLVFDGILEIYKSGINRSDEFFAGWIGRASLRGNGESGDPVPSQALLPTIVNEHEETPNQLTFNFDNYSNGSNRSGLAYTVNPIDMTAFNTLTVYGTYAIDRNYSGYKDVRLDTLVFDEYDSYYDNALGKNNFYQNVGENVPVSGTFSSTISLSEINGTHRIGIGMLMRHVELTVTITEMTLK